MPRTHGYAPKGKRCFGRHNWRAAGRTNVIGALLAGLLLTTLLCDFNIDADIFHEWITHELIPKLPPGAVLVMDNASFHNAATHNRRSLMQDISCNTSRPYSPDLNPIEHKWAQAKAIRRKTAKTDKGNLQNKILNQIIMPQLDTRKNLKSG